MNNIKKNYKLSIETTGKTCGVALAYNNNVIFENNINNGLTHSVTLFNNIDIALTKNKIDITKINHIYVSSGPGSFTGIRIGIAAALGLAKPYNTKIKYIDTLDSLAYNVKNTADIIISIIDAKANRVYMSIYYGNTLKKILADSIYDIDVLINNLNNYFLYKNINFIFVGDACLVYNDIFREKLKIKYKIADKEDLLQKASSLFFCNGITSSHVYINYMLKSKAERERLNAEN